MAAAVWHHVARDITILGIEVDEATVRRVLAALPGVTPLPAEDDADETGTDAGDVAANGAGPAGDDETHGAGGPGGPHARVDDRADPDTPWPGAPFDEGEEESEGRDWKRIGLAVGLVLGLGVVGVALVWGVREWRSRKSDDEDRETDPLDAAAAGMRDEGTDAGEATDDETAAAAERSPPMNLSPVIGMAFLAAGAVVLRGLYRARDGD